MMTLLSILSTLCLFASAIFWFWASRVKTPGLLHDKISGGGPFADALAKQARLNAVGAVLAAIGVALQAIVQAAPLLGIG